VTGVEERGAAVHDAVASIDGWLEPGDSMKLYELGCSTPGPFLEIGTYRGKSTAVLATALRDADRSVEFFSLDIAGDDLGLAGEALSARGLEEYVTLVHGSVRAFFRARPAFRPRFVFIDGDHSEKGVGRDLAALETRLPAGGLLLFHDFTDPRNDDPEDAAYGVSQAIAGSWVARDCKFGGEFGCAGLYHRVRGPEVPQDGEVATLELIGLDRPQVRLLVNVARPLKRRAVRWAGRFRTSRPPT